MSSEKVLTQVVSSMGRDITVVDPSGTERTERAKITVEQSGGSPYSWSDIVDLSMETRVLTMTASSGVDISHTFKFENKEWWPTEIREIQGRHGDVTGYRILVYETGAGDHGTLSDGTTEVEVVSDRINESPGELKRGEIEVPGADENNIQDLGKANEVTEMLMQIGRWTRVDESRAGSIQSVEDVIEAWHDDQTKLEFKRNNSTADVILNIKNFQRFEEAEVVLAEISLIEVS